MLRTMLKSKIHRATVTEADLHYVGSVTIDADLMDAADLLAGEQVTIVDVTNGARLVTYAITGILSALLVGATVGWRFAPVCCITALLLGRRAERRATVQGVGLSARARGIHDRVLRHPGQRAL